MGVKDQFQISHTDLIKCRRTAYWFFIDSWVHSPLCKKSRSTEYCYIVRFSFRFSYTSFFVWEAAALIPRLSDTRLPWNSSPCGQGGFSMLLLSLLSIPPETYQLPTSSSRLQAASSSPSWLPREFDVSFLPSIVWWIGRFVPGLNSPSSHPVASSNYWFYFGDRQRQEQVP